MGREKGKRNKVKNRKIFLKLKGKSLFDLAKHRVAKK